MDTFIQNWKNFQQPLYGWDDVLRDRQTASPFAAPVPSDVVDRLLPEIQEHVGFGKETLNLHFQSITLWGPNSELVLITMQHTMLVLRFI